MANRVEVGILDNIQGNTPKYMTFVDLLERYLKEVTPIKKVIRQESNRLKALLKTNIANFPISEIRPSIFADYRDERLKSVSGGTVEKELSLLSNICNFSIKEWNILKDNPIKKISYPKKNKARTRRPTEDKIRRLCIALNYDENKKPELIIQRIAIAFLFAIETAMRAGEICSLTWDNVDLNKRIAYLPITKNGFARDIPLSKRAVELLEKLKGIDEIKVFNIDSASLDTLFRKAKKKCEL